MLLTILDFYLEIFHTNHPLGDGYAYEEQKSAAKRRTKDFLAVRLPPDKEAMSRLIQPDIVGVIPEGHLPDWREIGTLE